MKRTRKLLPIAALLLVCSSRGIAADSCDLNHAWFEPSLTTNNDPICADVLAGAKIKFVSDARWLDFNYDILGISERVR